jgi:hypothetical protein
VFLRLEIIKKTYGVLILLASVLFFDDVLVIAAGSVVSTLIATFVNAAPNKRLLGYRYLEQVKDLLPSLGLTAVMGGAVWLAGLLPLGDLPLLLTQTAVGAGVYAGLSLLLKPQAYVQMADMVKAVRRR